MIAPGHMRALKVGLTGGIGSGKSAVAHLLAHYEIPIIDADVIAADLTNNDAEIHTALRNTFGAKYFENRGTLKRAELGKLVFSDEKALRALNDILHPKILFHIQQRIKELEKKKQTIIVVDAALIYEIKIERQFDVVIVADAPLQMRVNRIKKRDNLPDEQIMQRINAQMPLEKKVQCADYVIDNSGSLFSLRGKVRALLDWLNVKRNDI